MKCKKSTVWDNDSFIQSETKSVKYIFSISKMHIHRPNYCCVNNFRVPTKTSNSYHRLVICQDIMQDNMFLYNNGEVLIN